MSTESMQLVDKRIVLGVSGSIACYKAITLASRLAQAGAAVDVILTAGARRFVAPLTFQSVTGRRAYTDDDLWGSEAHVLHVGLAHNADLLAVVPASAHTLAKLAGGHSNDLLSITALAATCPLLVAPAMDGGMFDHPATQHNVTLLRERGAIIVGPETGHLASGLTGVGRMSEPASVLACIANALSDERGALDGRCVVVTAGGTREAIDPVRFIGNRSTGKQGFALARAALDAGASVTLIATAEPPRDLVQRGVAIVRVESALEMQAAVLDAVRDADALLMAAAVADFRPTHVAPRKIKKGAGVPTIELTRNPDILAAVHEAQAASARPSVTVGFAAETNDVVENAVDKLRRKKLDLIVANDVNAAGAGFAVDTNRVTLLAIDGTREELPLQSKDDVAHHVVERVANLLNEK